MKINGMEVKGNFFAYDGCHKIYVLENRDEILEAESNDYEIFAIRDIENAYNNSCELKFINNWSLTTVYVGQFETVKFE